MDLLLDSHALLWTLYTPAVLPSSLAGLLRDPRPIWRTMYVILIAAFTVLILVIAYWLFRRTAGIKVFRPVVGLTFGLLTLFSFLYFADFNGAVGATEKFPAVRCHESKIPPAQDACLYADCPS